MIDPVSNRGYYEYGKINTQMTAGMETGEKFGLNYDTQEKESDKKDGKKVEEKDGVIAEFSSQSGNRQAGVGNKDGNAKTQEQSRDIGETVEQVRGFIGKLTKAISDFFAGIKQSLVAFWNSDSSMEQAEDVVAESEDVTAEAAAEEVLMGETEVQTGDALSEAGQGFEENAVAAMEAERRGASAQTNSPIIPDPKSPDYTRQIQAYLEQQGQNAYVKNSDLLTYYDRSGRIVQMNGADKKRILHGDRNDGRY